MRPLGAVPLDDAFVEAARAGKAPIDHAPHSPGIEASRELASRIGDLSSATVGSVTNRRGEQRQLMGDD